VRRLAGAGIRGACVHESAAAAPKAHSPGGAPTRPRRPAPPTARSEIQEQVAVLQAELKAAQAAADLEATLARFRSFLENGAGRDSHLLRGAQRGGALAAGLWRVLRMHAAG
jgi:hypothetical protein